MWMAPTRITLPVPDSGRRDVPFGTVFAHSGQRNHLGPVPRSILSGAPVHQAVRCVRAHVFFLGWGHRSPQRAARSTRVSCSSHDVRQQSVRVPRRSLATEPLNSAVSCNLSVTQDAPDGPSVHEEKRRDENRRNSLNSAPRSLLSLLSKPRQQILQPFRHGLHGHRSEQQPEDSGGDVESRESEPLGD